jgi:hypothetical protein
MEQLIQFHVKLMDFLFLKLLYFKKRKKVVVKSAEEAKQQLST